MTDPLSLNETKRLASTADTIRLASCVQTFTQTPQPIHRSGRTCAWWSAMRMAFAGHSRTHW